MTGTQVKQIVMMLVKAYPRADLGEANVEAYMVFLADLDYDAALGAVKRLVSTHTFFPSIAEIRQAAMEIMHPLPVAEEAWGEVMAEVNRVGAYGTLRDLDFSCPEIHEAVRIVGWRAICLSETPGVERAHFLRTYQALRDRTRVEQNVGPLLGPRSGPVQQLAERLGDR